MRTKVMLFALFLTAFNLSEIRAVNPAPLSPTALTKAEFAELSNKDIATRIGRPLKGKEKVLLWAAKRKIRRELRRHPEQGSQVLILPQTTTDERETNQAGLLSFIIAIIALLAGAFAPLLSLLGFVASIVLGISSLGQFKRMPKRYKGRGWAIAGLVLSGLILLLSILTIILLFVAFG